MSASSLSPARRHVLERRIRSIVVSTVCWNVIEAGVAIVSGGIASSAVLVAFGLRVVAV